MVPRYCATGYFNMHPAEGEYYCSLLYAADKLALTSDSSRTVLQSPAKNAAHGIGLCVVPQ